MSHLDSFNRFRYGSDLVELDKNRVSASFFDSLGESLGICNKEVVSDNLKFVAEFFGHEFPTCPILFVESVFD